MTDVRETLNERKNTHGDYNDHANTTQKIKDVIRSGPSYGQLDAHERETLDMIAHKIGRIVSGNPHFHDHWHDIAGYATLSADRNADTDSKPVAPLTIAVTDDSLLQRAINLYLAGPVYSYLHWEAAGKKYGLGSSQSDRGWDLLKGISATA